MREARAIKVRPPNLDDKGWMFNRAYLELDEERLWEEIHNMLRDFQCESEVDAVLRGCTADQLYAQSEYWWVCKEEDSWRDSAAQIALGLRVAADRLQDEEDRNAA